MTETQGVEQPSIQFPPPIPPTPTLIAVSGAELRAVVMRRCHDLEVELIECLLDLYENQGVAITPGCDRSNVMRVWNEKIEQYNYLTMRIRWVTRFQLPVEQQPPQPDPVPGEEQQDTPPQEKYEGEHEMHPDGYDNDVPKPSNPESDDLPASGPTDVQDGVEVNEPENLDAGDDYEPDRSDNVTTDGPPENKIHPQGGGSQ